MKVTIRCPFCTHILKVFDYSDLYVFTPTTLKMWAGMQCPNGHTFGYELLIESEEQGKADFESSDVFNVYEAGFGNEQPG